MAEQLKRVRTKNNATDETHNSKRTGRDGINIEHLGQDTCKTIATDEASNLQRTMTDGLNNVEFQLVERIKITKEVKMDGT